MLLKMWLLTPSLLIRVAVPMTILFSMIFISFSQSLIGGLYGHISMRSHISFSMSIVLVRSAYRGQLAKSLSFSLQSSFVLLIHSSIILLFGA